MEIQEGEKAILKRCVFRRRLNVVREGEDLISAGRAFHNLGAQIEKEQSPIEQRDERGIFKRGACDDRRARGTWRGERAEER